MISNKNYYIGAQSEGLLRVRCWLGVSKGKQFLLSTPFKVAHTPRRAGVQPFVASIQQEAGRARKWGKKETKDQGSKNIGQRLS